MVCQIFGDKIDYRVICEFAPAAPAENYESSVSSTKKKVIRVKLLRQPCFLCLLINNVAIFAGLAAFYIHLPSYLESVGFSKDQSAIFVSLSGGAGIPGRLVSPYIAQKLKNSLAVFNCVISAMTIAILCSPFLESKAIISVNCMVLGFSLGACGSVSPLLISELVGMDSMSDGYGYVCMAQGIGCLVGPPISGFAYDGTNSYVWALCLAGAINLAGTLVTVSYQIIHEYKLRSATKRPEFFHQTSVNSMKSLISSSEGVEADFLEI